MINIVILFIALFAIYTKVVFFEILLYLLISSFFIIQIRTLFIDNKIMYDVFNKIENFPLNLNNNAAIINIMMIFLPLAYGGMWALSSMWVTASIIQHKSVYNYIEYRRRISGRRET